MINEGFKDWLRENTAYSDAVIKDILSRAKRADKIKEWDNSETYLFYLEREKEFSALPVSVKSQIRRAIKLYSSYNEALDK